jgi:nucleoside-diphosphate-sugar epimerase
MNKVLITGSSGFLGSIIKNNILNYTIFELNSNSGDYHCNLKKEIPLLTEVFDLVIHSAGKAHSVPRTDFEKQEFYDVNVTGTQNLLKALEKVGFPKQFVFISSVSVYGLDSGKLINEEDPLLAKDAYGRSKIIAEQVVVDWCTQNKVICTILRLPLLVGANPPGNLGSMLSAIDKGFYFNIDGGKANKSMVLASDVGKFIQLVSPIGGIYNLTDGIHPNFKDLSTAISVKKNKKKPFNLPFIVAKILCYIGDLLGSRSPINSSKVNKITSTLTFDDSKARAIENWKPQSVLEYLKENSL